MDLNTLEVTKLYSKNAHVEALAWSPDGSQILLLLHQTPELDSPFYSGIQFETISVQGTSTHSPTFLSDFPGPVLGNQPIWTSTGEIFFRAGATPRSNSTSMALYRLRQDDKTRSWSKFSHGDIDCVVDLRSDHDIIFGEVHSGLSAEIHVLCSDGKKAKLVLYSGNEKINSWDAKATEDEGYVLALSKSNAFRPLELSTVEIDGPTNSINVISNLDIKENNKEKSRDPSIHLPLHATNLTQITQHSQDLTNALNLEISSKTINCKSQDRTTDLDAVFVAPTVTLPNPYQPASLSTAVPTTVQPFPPTLTLTTTTGKL